MYKKIFLSTIVFLATISLSMGQQAFHKTDKAINLGIGLGWGYTNVNLAPIPSFNISFETGIAEIPKAGVITIGGYGDFRHTWRNYKIAGIDFRDNWTNSILAARAAFHLGFLNTDKFDVYGGFATGIRIQAYSGDGGSNTTAHLIHDSFVGGRIMMSKSFAFFAEAGYGASYLKAGITFKF